MPLYTPVNFNAAYEDNQRGRLSADQLTALTKMLKSRIFVGILLFFCDLFMVALFGAVLLSGDWEKEFTFHYIIFLYFWREEKSTKINKSFIGI